MYIILWWKDADNYLDVIKNDDGSIKLFETLGQADDFADNHKHSVDLRVISIEGVKE